MALGLPHHFLVFVVAFDQVIKDCGMVGASVGDKLTYCRQFPVVFEVDLS